MGRTHHLVAAASLLAGLLVGGVASAEDNARGAQLYGLCAQCHGPNGGGNELVLAPSIAGLPLWYVEKQLMNFKHGLRGTNPEDVAGLKMYPMSLSLKSDADVAAVAAHVASMPRADPPQTLEGGNAEAGIPLYQTCVQCHGADGGGNEQLGAPPLRGQSDWYLLSSIQRYKAGIRGGNPQNQSAVLMRGMSNVLPTDQAMKDVIAHIMTFDNQVAAAE